MGQSTGGPAILYAASLLALLFVGSQSNAFAQGGSSGSYSRSRGDRRLVTVADAIRMTTASDGDELSNGSVALFSPDGQKCVVVLKKGNLEQNTNEYSLLLWQTKSVFGARAPESILRMSSASNLSAIADLTWSADNETL